MAKKNQDSTPRNVPIQKGIAKLPQKPPSSTKPNTNKK